MQFLEFAKKLDDAQTRKEFEIAFKTGDPNLMNSAGLGVIIRASVLGDADMGNRDRLNLADIDDAVGKLPPLEQVKYRTQLLFELYQCGDSVQCKKNLLSNQASSSSKAVASPSIPNSASGFWGNQPTRKMTPEQNYTAIASGFESWNNWNKKHFKNERPIFRVYGFQFECKRGASAETSRVLADIPHFYGTVRKLLLSDTNYPIPDLQVIFKPEKLSVSVGTRIDISAIPLYFVNDILQALSGTQVLLRQGDVRLSFIGENAWTFRTEPNHVVYDNSKGAFPGQISFALYDLGTSNVRAFVVAQGNFRDDATVNQFYWLGASAIEDAIWNDWAYDINYDCRNK